MTLFLRHVTQNENHVGEYRNFGEILARDIFISYLTNFRQTMRLFPQTLENPVQAQVQHCQKEHRQLIKFKIIPNITHNKPNICNQYRKYYYVIFINYVIINDNVIINNVLT